MPSLCETMKNKCNCLGKPTSQDKWRYTLYTTLIFLVVVAPFTYLLVNSVLGSLLKVCDKNGCPTTAGLMLHALVFTLILRYMMDLDL